MSTLSASLDVIPRSRNALVEQCRTYIDKDIAALAESLRVLRSRRNALAWISSLPSDILVTIFTSIMEEETFNRYTNPPRRCCAPTSMIVTHVCRHWRQVALECPTLWAYINCASSRWVPIMLERSKKAALVVTYSAPDSLEQSMEQVLSQLPRIKVLQLCSFQRDVNRVLDCLSSQPAPLLQIFKFSVTKIFRRRMFGPISEDIFQGRAPQLRSVELTQCHFSWTLCLRHMPGLEQLMLDLPSIISEDTELFDQVPVTRLKGIVLETWTIQTATSLFSHLLLPDDVGIALKLAQDGSPEVFSKLFSAMYKVPNESVPIIRSLRANLLHDTFGVQFCTSMAFKSEYLWNPHDCDIQLSIQFTCDKSTRNPAIIFDMCRMVPHHNIHSLFMSSTLDLPEDFWRAGSADLPELKSIHLTRTPIGGLIAALQSGGGHSSDIVYPLLHALELENIDFGYDEVRDFQDTVTMRADHGVGIHKLRLAKCRNLEDDEVQLFQLFVTDVDWDGHEEALTDPDGGVDPDAHSED
ncbi:hypothetical protein DFH29DRAFT_1083837 [Suillus ampliporus]|nr:hypothetical protein DFH29DRAFT_1083837 [Suillus ampliporus]